MHELSIANSLVEIVTEHAAASGADRVLSVTLRLGALSCVNKGALEFSFDLITEDTILRGAKLHFIDVPVSVSCDNCSQVVELPGIQKFCCPVCQTPSADIRAGRELEVEHIEIASNSGVIKA